MRNKLLLILHLNNLFKGRGDPTRTGDRLVPNQERYQLRYTPKELFFSKALQIYIFFFIPPTVSRYFNSNYISLYLSIGTLGYIGAKRYSVNLGLLFAAI